MSHYSIIKYVNSQWTGEFIAVGLAVFCEDKAYYRISQAKVDFIKIFRPENFKLFNDMLTELNEFMAHPDLSTGVKEITLHHYQAYLNGVFQITKPEAIEKDFDDTIFDQYFKKMIG